MKISNSSKKKVALGLSGGVDSAVCAKILLNQGYEVTGVYLECFRESGCRADQDRQDALSVAMQLQIPFQSLDLREAYRQEVLDYFYHSYQAGQTPNPDLLCNREIKFGLFYEWAMSENFDLIATGHYARIKTKANEKQNFLYTARDKNKDQTYFLALVESNKWVKVLFPVGDLTKKEVRNLADQWQLPVATKKDSTGVCFVGEVGIKDFLNRQIATKKGEVVRDDKIIGEHDGAAFYTVGQRHGMRIFQESTHTPQLYVLKKDVMNNRLIVGEKKECYNCLFNVKNIDKSSNIWNLDVKNLFVRVRHQGEMLGIRKLIASEGTLQVELSEPAFALSTGQFAVFYLLDNENKNEYFLVSAGEIVTI